MRPIKLSMTAFGPYKNNEVIDFTKLQDHRLFVISGNTGAGKTTIFDAICFALYGSASGEDRNDVKALRSDFAADDVHTCVELEFELRGRYFRVKRQLPHVKKGNKTATGEQYEFFEKINGEEVPCVDRQRVTEINKKIEDLLGLSKEQFSQIVMLPQGEFRKLLTSETENKEEILRKIFKTERYSWISSRLKDKKKQAEDEYKQEQANRERLIKDIQAVLPPREHSTLFQTLSQEQYNTHQVLSGMAEEADFYETMIHKQEKQEETAGLALNKKLEEFHKAESLNAEFLKLENKEKELQEYVNQGPSFKDKERKLENAERAAKIESYELQTDEWRRDELEKQERLNRAAALKIQAEAMLEKAERTYNNEEKKKDEREKASQELHRLKELLPLVKESEQKKQALAAAFNEVQMLEKQLQSLEKNISEQKSLKNLLSQEIKEMEKKVDTLPDKQQKLLQLRELVKVLQDYKNLMNHGQELEAEQKSRISEYHLSKQRYESLESAWLNGQASLLAAHLHDGQPCPVCGSREHPLKAQSQEKIPTKEELEAVKTDFNRKDVAYRNITAKVNSLLEQLKQKEAEVLEYGVKPEEVPVVYEQVVTQGQRLKEEVALLANEKDRLAKLKADYEQKEEKVTEAEALFATETKKFQQRYTTFEADKAVYQEQLQRIPDEVRNLTALEKKIAEIEARKIKLEQAWEEAQKTLQNAKEEETKAQINYVNAQQQLTESKERKARAEKQFHEALQKAGFTAEKDYREAKVSEDERKQLKLEIDSYQKLLAATTLQVKELKAALADKTKVDLESLKTELEQLKEAYTKAQELLRSSKQHRETIQRLTEQIAAADETTSHLEKRFHLIADLYDVVRGQNSSKISFERYLQIEFLEQIIVAANERLKHLSNGQFMLMRSERQESRGKQSGLGLDVYDAYTGQTRDVKTLSGGEKFNASLCLALGMADVIQSYQGGISIDTMFIDEGFGSLDEESLTKAIDTLIDLQKSGRMIGVISHVQELKNAIPAILEVKKTKEGCSQTQFMIK